MSSPDDTPLVAPPDKPFADWWWAAAGSAVWVAVLAAIKPTLFVGLDFVRIVEPYQRYLGDSLRLGALPWWNPYASLGRPFLADLQTASFYPPTWLTVLFGVKAGTTLELFLHGGMALLGFFRLARSWNVARPAAWGGALAYLFSAPLVMRLQAGQLNYVFSLCYLPLVLPLAARFAFAPTRRRWVALALVWAWQLLCCHPQVFWLSALAAGLFVTGLVLQPPWGTAVRLWLRAAAGLLLACVTGMALLGFVLVPFAELVGQSNRAMASEAFSAAFAMNLDQAMSLLTTASRVTVANWEYNAHLGVAVGLGGLAALFRWRDPIVRGLLLMAGVGALIMIGDVTPFFGLFYKVLPGFSSFRVPARAGVLVVLGLCAGASLLAGTKPTGRRPWLAAVLAGGLVATGLAAYYATHLAGWPGAASWMLGQSAWLGASVGAWWLWLKVPATPAPATANARRWALPAVAAGQVALAVFTWKLLPGYPAEFPAEDLVRAAVRTHGLEREAAPPRVNLPPDLVRDNSGMLYRYATLTGFESLSLGRVWVYLHRAAGVDPHHAYNTTPDGHVYEAGDRLAATGVNITLPAGASTLQIKATPASRAWLVATIAPVTDADEAARRIAAGADLHQAALVEPAYATQTGHLSSDSAGGTAHIERFTMNSLDVAVDSPGAALLVVAEAWYPGWHATIGGREVACLPVNGWMRGVPVPAGRSLVTLRFRQNGLLAGTLVSVLTAALLGGLGWLGRDPAARD
ncbi:MAG TPA: YfhO family protein [Lacunisphaera sp.]|nr:YfhO family protein [Lacunisphaera sp.]